MTLDTPAVRRANKGEWSEIYAFFKLVVDRKLKAIDENLQFIEGSSFDVLKIVREEEVKKVYSLETVEDQILLSEDEGSVNPINTADLRNGVKQIFDAIKSGTGSFPLPEAEEFMKALACTSIKASSKEKSDIRLIIHDRFSPGEVESGFSIKTSYGSKPTLLNASGQNTCFTFEVISGETPRVSETAVVPDRVRDVVVDIYGEGSMKFLHMESPVFEKNLEYIDSTFPKIMAAMLTHYFKGDANKVSELTEIIAKDEEFRGRELSFYRHKVKAFLEAVALGMTPAKSWDGTSHANGGYIIVRDDGELACYHLYNRDKFLEYLYTHTKFDTPSTTRHKYGAVIEENGKKIIRLNLQVRFT